MTWVLGMEAFSVSPVEAFYKVTSHLFKQLLNCSAGPWLAVAEQNPSEHSASHLDTLLVTISFRSWRHPTIALYEGERKTAHETNYDPPHLKSIFHGARAHSLDFEQAFVVAPLMGSLSTTLEPSASRTIYRSVCCMDDST